MISSKQKTKAQSIKQHIKLYREPMREKHKATLQERVWKRSIERTKKTWEKRDRESGA